MKQSSCILATLVFLVTLLFSSCVKNLDYYVIGVSVNPAGSATVTGGGMYAKGTTATLAVTPTDGYTFIAWSDGNTDNPRSVTVTADADYTAQCIVTPNGGGNQDGNYDNIVIWGLKNNGTYDNLWVPYCNVTIDSSYIGLYRSEDGYLAGYLCFSPYGSLPGVWFMIPCVYTGTNTYSDNNDDGYLENAMVEYWSSQDSVLESSDGITYGNWWGKEITVTISAIDLTNKTVSLEVSGIMFDAYKYFVDKISMSACPTKQLYIKLTNARFYSAN